MKIIETELSIIIDGFEINGFVDEERNCDICKTNLVFYDNYDAYFCPKCNYWGESKCSDENCIFCKSRPDKPIPYK